jgi:hypothetical protein
MEKHLKEAAKSIVLLLIRTYVKRRNLKKIFKDAMEEHYEDRFVERRK